MTQPPVQVEAIDLGRMRYADALERQRAALAEAVALREEAGERWRSSPMRLLLVEHDPPVVTVSRRPGAARHLLASPQRLAELGVEVAETDRGGDVTWHGPGQLVAYPIFDLKRLGLGVHGYMRFLEQCVIDTLAQFGLAGERDEAAIGVWITAPQHPSGAVPGGAKICAMGVRVSRWVSMHGLALNVDPDLGQFELIVPCGLAGRPVTSMRRELGEACPSVAEVKVALEAAFRRRLSARE
jgi:lipoyl(octanoyl) transferase